MKGIALVALGGAVGSVLRYLVSFGLASGVPGGYPLATLLVNLIGCFAFGILSVRLLPPDQGGESLRLLLLVGLLGGFTTFSAFGGELAASLRGHSLFQAALHLGLNTVGGVALVLAGIFVAERFLGPVR